MIDWPVVNRTHPEAVAFAIDAVGQAWLFGDVPRFVANRWCVGHQVWKLPLGLMSLVPSSPASTLLIREDKQPKGYENKWEPQGPEPLKPGEKRPQAEPVHARGWATSDPAPLGMSMISDEEASGAQKATQKSLMPGVVINERVTRSTTSVIDPAKLTPKPPKAATTMILTKVVLDLVQGLPEGKRRDGLLALLIPPE